MHSEQSQTSFSTDRELMTRCRQGDRKAFNNLIMTYQHQVFTYLSHLTADRGTAEELTKNTFVAAYKRVNRYSEDLSIKGWLLALAEQQLHAQPRSRNAWLTAFFSKRKPQPDQADAGPEILGTRAQASPDCQTISPELSAYLDGELNQSDAKRVEHHLQHCEQCQQEFDELVETLNMVQTFGQHQAPPDLRVHINAAIDASPSLWSSPAQWFGMPGSRIVAVMAMLMLVFSALLYNQQQHIQFLQHKFVSDIQRSGGSDGEMPNKTTFVILTGALTAKDMLLENAEWFSKHIASSAEETKLFSVHGSQDELRRMLAERIRAINGTIIADERLQEKSFHARTLTVEVPEDSSQFFLSVLRPLDAEQPASQHVVNTTTLRIMIIEKQ